MTEKTGDQSSTPADLDEVLSDRDVFSGQPIKFTEMQAWAKKNGFIYGRSGIYWDYPDRPYSHNFLSIKGCHRFESGQTAQEGLELVKDLTQRGVFYHATEWGMYVEEQGTHQLFARMPILEDFMSGSPSGELEPYHSVPIVFDGKVRHEWTGILDLYQRIDPSFDPAIGPTPDSLVRLVNPVEASQGDNWGWGDDGRSYPIDTEVIQLTSPMEQEILHAWYESQQKVI